MARYIDKRGLVGARPSSSGLPPSVPRGRRRGFGGVAGPGVGQVFCLAAPARRRCCGSAARRSPHEVRLSDASRPRRSHHDVVVVGARAPAPRRPGCWPGPATTWSWSTGPTRPATPTRRTRCPAAASCSSTAGDCWTTWSPAAPPRSGPSPSTTTARRAVRHGQGPGRGRLRGRAAALRARRPAGRRRRRRRRPPGHGHHGDRRAARRRRAGRRGDRPRRRRHPPGAAARLVVGADGLRSSVARYVGAQVVERHDPTGACLLHLRRRRLGRHPAPRGGRRLRRGLPDPPRRGLRLADPAGRRSSRPGGRSRPAPPWLRAAGPHLPELARTGEGPDHRPAPGLGRAPQPRAPAGGPGWALVGDAGYHRDPITGHGMTDAFRDAELLADAATACSPGRSCAAHGALRAAARRRAGADLRADPGLGAFPPPAEFLELQGRLSRALDAEALALADRPLQPATTTRRQRPRRLTRTTHRQQPNTHTHTTEEETVMSITQESHINGVDTATLFATIDAVRDQPELAKFRFRTVNDWVAAPTARAASPGFYGAGQEHTHVHPTWSGRTTRPCSSATTTARRRPSCCSTPWRLPDRRPRQHRRRAGRRAEAVSAAGSRATSTCAASSASTTPCATASRTSGSCSRSTATRTPSGSKPGRAVAPARRCSTCSPTAPP